MVSYHHIKFYYFVLSFPDALRIFLNRQPDLSKEEVRTRLAAVNKHVATLLRDVTNSAKNKDMARWELLVPGIVM